MERCTVKWFPDRAGRSTSAPIGETNLEARPLDAYEGDFLLRIDPDSDQIEVLGSPVPGYGVPSLAGTAGLGLVYGEAVDPAIEPKDGPFFAYDMAAEAVVYASPEADDHQGFRNIAVDASGKAYFSGADFRLLVFDPATNQVTDYPGELPGKWLRASTQPAPDGTIYAATREPDMLFSFTPEGTVTTLGPAPDYVASLAMHPDGTRFFYIPSAHGKSWQSGAPLMEVNIATGEQRVLVELNPLGEAGAGTQLRRDLRRRRRPGRRAPLRRHEFGRARERKGCRFWRGCARRHPPCLSDRQA